jgi:hypothetical protein
MKQLLLLLTIHSLIFHQQEKDQKEKLFVTLEKGSTVKVKPQIEWNLFSQMPEDAPYESFYSHVPGPVLYHFRNYPNPTDKFGNSSRLSHIAKAGRD